MRPPGHSLCSAPAEWLQVLNIDSLAVLSRAGGAWSTLGRWGADVGEPPDPILCRSSSLEEWGPDQCRRVGELRGSGQVRACLLGLDEGLCLWLTSSDPNWAFTSPMAELLRLITQEVSLGAEEQRGDPRADTAAHDIRNQLSLALLRLERLESGDKSGMDDLRGALRAGRSMCNAFLEGGGGSADVLLRPVLEEEVKAALYSAGRTSLRVGLRCGSMLKAHVQELAVRRFVQNALLNAIAAAPDESRLVVEVSSARPGLLELSIADSGPGMDSARVEAAYTSGRSGRGSTGLGSDSLLLAARDLGSMLTVETAPGHGTRTSVSLRAVRADRPASVVLDGDPLRVDGVLERLWGLGWWAAHARSVEECVAAVERHAADRVFVRRGSAGASLRELHAATADLGVPVDVFSDDAELS